MVGAGRPVSEQVPPDADDQLRVYEPAPWVISNRIICPSAGFDGGPIVCPLAVSVSLKVLPALASTVIVEASVRPTMPLVTRLATASVPEAVVFPVTARVPEADRFVALTAPVKARQREAPRLSSGGHGRQHDAPSEPAPGTAVPRASGMWVVSSDAPLPPDGGGPVPGRAEVVGGAPGRRLDRGALDLRHLGEAVVFPRSPASWVYRASSWVREMLSSSTYQIAPDVLYCRSTPWFSSARVRVVAPVVAR